MASKSSYLRTLFASRIERNFELPNLPVVMNYLTVIAAEVTRLIISHPQTSPDSASRWLNNSIETGWLE